MSTLLSFVFSNPFDVILSPVTLSGVEVCVIFIQGAYIAPSAYIPLMSKIQLESSPFISMWVGIPEFEDDFVDSQAEVNRGINRVMDKMKAAGMLTKTLIVAGHSLGGATVQVWTANHTEVVTAQVLMGSFLTHQWTSNFNFEYAVPTLTIGAELDGLARVTRFAEAFYTQLIAPYTVDLPFTSLLPANALHSSFPVTVIEGINHMQFASGAPTEAVLKWDLLPERTNAEAHALIAGDFVVFMSVQLLLGQRNASALRNRILETNAFVAPILGALHLEGYRNFRPPCLCNANESGYRLNCTVCCPFTVQASQQIMADVGVSGSAVEGLQLNDTDNLHGTWERKRNKRGEADTEREPTVVNTCYEPVGCILSTTTDTRASYGNKGVNDTSLVPISACELQTKMNSRESVFVSAGAAINKLNTISNDRSSSFEILDGTDAQCCGEINQRALDWAYAHVGGRTLERFKKFGQPYVIGSDIDVHPAGIWAVCFIYGA